MVEKAVAEGGRNILGPAVALCQREALTHAQAPGIGETELPCETRQAGQKCRHDARYNEDTRPRSSPPAARCHTEIRDGPLLRVRESTCDQPDRRHTASAIFSLVQPAAREPLDRLGARHVASLDQYGG